MCIAEGTANPITIFMAPTLEDHARTATIARTAARNSTSTSAICGASSASTTATTTAPATQPSDTTVPFDARAGLSASGLQVSALPSSMFPEVWFCSFLVYRVFTKLNVTAKMPFMMQITVSEHGAVLFDWLSSCSTCRRFMYFGHPTLNPAPLAGLKQALNA